MKKVLLFGILVGFILYIGVGQPFAASFQNGDFETGDFSGWSGDLEPVTGTVNPDSDSHFTIIPDAGPGPSNVAKIQNDDTDWVADLFQDFDMDSLNGPGWTMDITFWVKWSPTDSSQDNIMVSLTDLNSYDSFDLLSGIPDSDLMNGTWITQDITSFASQYGGNAVELGFTISDGDYQTPDSFMVDNISFNQHVPSPVPVPASVLLLGSGIAGLMITRRKKSN